MENLSVIKNIANLLTFLIILTAGSRQEKESEEVEGLKFDWKKKIPPDQKGSKHISCNVS